MIDITAVIVNRAEKCVRWHLYDIKDTLAGENTVVKLYNQWNAGLGYLRDNILLHLSEYAVASDLGVITRVYDEARMERLRNEYQKICDEIGNDRHLIFVGSLCVLSLMYDISLFNKYNTLLYFCQYHDCFAKRVGWEKGFFR